MPDMRVLGRVAGAWAHDAACRTMDPNLFTADLAADGGSRSLAQAREACAACPVSEQCLLAALEARETTGVRAGTTPAQRTAALSAARADSAAGTLADRALPLARASADRALRAQRAAAAVASAPGQPAPVFVPAQRVPAEPVRDPLARAVALVLDAARPVPFVADLTGLPLRTIVLAVRAESARRAATPAAAAAVPVPKPGRRAYGKQKTDANGEVTFVVRVSADAADAVRDAAARTGTPVKALLREAIERVAAGSIPSPPQDRPAATRQVGTTLSPQLRDTARAAADAAGLSLKDAVAAALVEVSASR